MILRLHVREEYTVARKTERYSWTIFEICAQKTENDT